MLLGVRGAGAGVVAHALSWLGAGDARIAVGTAMVSGEEPRATMVLEVEGMADAEVGPLIDAGAQPRQYVIATSALRPALGVLQHDQGHTDQDDV